MQDNEIVSLFPRGEFVEFNDPEIFKEADELMCGISEKFLTWAEKQYMYPGQMSFSWPLEDCPEDLIGMAEQLGLLFQTSGERNRLKLSIRESSVGLVVNNDSSPFTIGVIPEEHAWSEGGELKRPSLGSLSEEEDKSLYDSISMIILRIAPKEEDPSLQVSITDIPRCHGELSYGDCQVFTPAMMEFLYYVENIMTDACKDIERDEDVILSESGVLRFSDAPHLFYKTGHMMRNIEDPYKKWSEQQDAMTRSLGFGKRISLDEEEYGERIKVVAEEVGLITTDQEIDDIEIHIQPDGLVYWSVGTSGKGDYASYGIASNRYKQTRELRFDVGLINADGPVISNGVSRKLLDFLVLTQHIMVDAWDVVYLEMKSRGEVAV